MSTGRCWKCWVTTLYTCILTSWNLSKNFKQCKKPPTISWVKEAIFFTWIIRCNDGRGALCSWIPTPCVDSQTCTFCLWHQLVSLVCLQKVILASCPAGCLWRSKFFRWELTPKLSIPQNVKRKSVWKIMMTKKMFYDVVNGGASRSIAGREVESTPKICDYSHEHRALSGAWWKIFM